MFRTSNPAFRNEAFRPAQTWDDLRQQGRIDELPTAEPVRAMTSVGAKTMTLQGTVNKTGFLITLCTGAAVLGWTATLEWGYSPMLVLFGGMIGALVVGLICSFAPKTSPFLSPIYAILEGGFLGGLSAYFATRFGGQEGDALNTGLIFNAILLTFGIAGGMLAGYSTGLIRPGPIFRNTVIAATLGVCLYGVLAMILGLFGVTNLLSVYDPSNGGLVSVGFSAFVVVLASANLVLDFDMVHNGVRNRAPKYMEWYGGFATLVTLAWLYVEVLRLLSKLQSRE